MSLTFFYEAIFGPGVAQNTNPTTTADVVDSESQTGGHQTIEAVQTAAPISNPTNTTGSGERSESPVMVISSSSSSSVPINSELPIATGGHQLHAGTSSSVIIHQSPVIAVQIPVSPITDIIIEQTQPAVETHKPPPQITQQAIEEYIHNLQQEYQSRLQVQPQPQPRHSQKQVEEYIFRLKYPQKFVTEYSMPPLPPLPPSPSSSSENTIKKDEKVDAEKADDDDLAPPLLKRHMVLRSASNASLASAVETNGAASVVPLERVLQTQMSLIKSAEPKLCEPAQNRLDWKFKEAVRLLELNAAKQATADAVFNKLTIGNFQESVIEKMIIDWKKSLGNFGEPIIVAKDGVDKQTSTSYGSTSDGSEDRWKQYGSAYNDDDDDADDVVHQEEKYEMFVKRLTNDNKSMETIYNIMKDISRAEKQKRIDGKTESVVKDSVAEKPEPIIDSSANDSVVEVLTAEEVKDDNEMESDAKSVENFERSSRESMCCVGGICRPIKAVVKDVELKVLEEKLATMEAKFVEASANVRKLEVKLRHKDTLYQQMKSTFKEREVGWQNMRVDRDRLAQIISEQTTSFERKLKQEQKAGRRREQNAGRRQKSTTPSSFDD